MDKIKNLFQSNDSKHGSYTLAMTSIVIAIVIIFNMIVNLVPENMRQIDISSTNIYEISSKSEKIIKNVDDDVTFYVLAQKDSTDKRIKTFINKYASLSKKIHVKWIDPVIHPSALTKYGTEENNIVVSCKKTNRKITVSFDDILVSDSSSYYSTSSSSASQFDGDGQHDASYLEQMAEELERTGSDMVIGSRFIEKEGFQSSGLRRVGIRYFSVLIKLMTGKLVTDPTSGMRMVNRQVMEIYAQNYPKDYPEPESVMAILRMGKKVTELPVVMREREEGSSSIAGFKSAYYMIKVTLAILMERLRR